MKKALITGITGQDGSYLAEFLLEKGYEVHGLIRRHSTLERFPNLNLIQNQLKLHQADLTDGTSLRKILFKIKPNEVYNLAAQSHVHISFSIPEFTMETNALGVLRLLEIIKDLKDQGHETRFFQASTSDMLDVKKQSPQTEDTPYFPKSPYGIAKLCAHLSTINFRDSYGLHASTGIMFNHESPRRGENFVTRKITKGLYEIKSGKKTAPLYLGNINSAKDRGHAKDYVEAMWLMLQHDKSDDYVVASGHQTSVREFCELSAKYFDFDIEWRGQGLEEIGVDKKTNQTIIAISEEFYRPAEVDFTQGDNSKAKKILGWQPKFGLEQLVHDMCLHETLQG